MIAALLLSFGVAASAGDPWYERHAFAGDGGWLAVNAGQKLDPGDSMLVFEEGHAPRIFEVAFVVPADSARGVFDRRGFEDVARDSLAWKRLGGAWALSIRSDPSAAAIARFRPDDEDLGLPVAFDLQGSQPFVTSAAPRILGRSEIRALLSGAARDIPRLYRGRGVLQSGRAFGPDFVEIFLGNPRRNSVGRGFRSVRICHLYLYRRYLAGMELATRTSGVQEHVDSEAPQLSDRNWFELPERTIGYLSRDGGSHWTRLSVDVGFEGVKWAASRVERRMPRAWELYRYTMH